MGKRGRKYLWGGVCALFAFALMMICFSTPARAEDIVIFDAGNGWDLTFDKSSGTLMKADKARWHQAGYKDTTLNIPEQIDGVTVRHIADEMVWHGNVTPTDITIPDTVVTIGKGVFKGSHLKSLKLPAGLTKIEKELCSGCSDLEEVVIPDGVTEIGDKAFDACYKLTVPQISENVKSIGEYAFSMCNATGKEGVDIVLPHHMTRLGSGVFYGCGSIKSVVIPGDTPEWENETMTVFYNAYQLVSVTFEEGVKKIQEGAFYACVKIETLNLPSSLEIIEDWAFGDSYALKRCVLPEGLKKIGGDAFHHSGLEELFVPDTVTEIGEFAFTLADLKTVVLGTGVKSLDKYVFLGCQSLESVYIPVNVKTLSERSFDACKNIKDIYYGGTQAQWRAMKGISESHIMDSSPVIHYNAAKPERTSADNANPETNPAANPETKPETNPAANPESAPDAGYFQDVKPGDYFYDSVKWAVESHITNGTDNMTFSPHSLCTKAHVITFLWRFRGSPEPMGENPYEDAPEGEYYTKAAVWAYEQGLSDGGRFNGSDPCQRIMAVTYLWRLAGSPSIYDSPFEDVYGVQEQAASWAFTQGVTQGVSETEFNPNGTCTRAQIVTFLYRARMNG